MSAVQILRNMASLFIITGVVFFAPQSSEAKEKHQEGDGPGISIQSAQLSIDGVQVAPNLATWVMQLLCNGRDVCHEEIWPQFFQKHGLLTSLNVVYTCRDVEGFHEFEINNEGKFNDGTFVRLNCHRAPAMALTAPTGLLGGESTPTGIMTSFALNIAEHLAGNVIDEFLFPPAIDQKALADAMAEVITLALDEAKLEANQDALNAQLGLPGNVGLATYDADVRAAMGTPSQDGTVQGVHDHLLNSSFVDDLSGTLRALRTDTEKQSTRFEAFTSYISAASALAGTLEFQDELDRYLPRDADGKPLRDTEFLSSLVSVLGDPDANIDFTLNTKGDMILQELVATRPVCKKFNDGYNDYFWQFKDCDGKVHGPLPNPDSTEWNEDACTINTSSSYQICAQREYATALSPNVMGWIDDTVQGWRDTLTTAAPLLASYNIPCDACRQSFITVDLVLFVTKDTKGNSIYSSSPTGDSVFFEARCNGLVQCDAYFKNKDLPGYNAGKSHSSNKTHISNLTVAYHCAADTSGTMRSYQALSGDLDSGGAWAHLDCDAPAFCTNPTTCVQ
ncbi:MAG: hypothetical protein R3F53_30420 [Gammaproteobacteria bacterium]